MSGLPGQQMARRYRTVALQAIGVALIAAFIFIAFLRPSEPGDLSGIDAPGGGDGSPAVDNRGDGGDGADKRKRRGGKKKPARRGSGDGGGGGGEFAGLGAIFSAAADQGFVAAVPDASGGSTAGGPGDSGRGGDSGSRGGGDGGDSGDGGEDPPDDQYDDLVSRLMSEVGTPAIFRALDP